MGDCLRRDRIHIAAQVRPCLGGLVFRAHGDVPPERDVVASADGARPAFSNIL
jgi:hypothetical protein